MTDVVRRFKLIRLFQRYVLNPPMKLMVSAGLSPHHVLLETRGRKSGKRRINIVGFDPDPDTPDSALWVVAEHGRRAGYVANLTAEPRIKVRYQRQWRDAVATPLPDDDPLPRLERWQHAATGRIIRKVGTSLLTIRIDLTDPAA